jgi:dephospho-CoA kinase
MTIIGLTGTIGAGKGTIAQYLVKQHGFKHYQVRDVLTQELNKQDIPVTRDSMREMANSLRNLYGSEYIVSQLRSLAQQSQSDTLIESIRTV